MGVSVVAVLASPTKKVSALHLACEVPAYEGGLTTAGAPSSFLVAIPQHLHVEARSVRPPSVAVWCGLTVRRSANAATVLELHVPRWWQLRSLLLVGLPN